MVAVWAGHHHGHAADGPMAGHGGGQAAGGTVAVARAAA